MTTSASAYEQLVAANPLVDDRALAPDLAEAQAFLRSIEEGLMNTKNTEVNPVEPAHQARGWVAAAIAFVVVIALVGAVAVLVLAGDAEEPPATAVPPATTAITPTTAAASPTTAPPLDSAPAAAEAAAIDVLLAAWNRGDWNEYRARFADAAVIGFNDYTATAQESSGVHTFDSLQRAFEWSTATGSRLELNTCTADSGEVRCTVDWLHPLFAEVRGARSMAITIAIADGLIVDYYEETTGNDFYWETEAFKTWTQERYPEDAAVMFANASPFFSPESVELWNEHLPEYVVTFPGIGASEVQIAIAERLESAFNTGDLAAYAALFASDAEFTFPDRGGPDVPQGRGSGTHFGETLEGWLDKKQWEVWLGGMITISECRDDAGAALCVVTYTDAFASPAMGQLEGTVAFALDADDRVAAFSRDWDASGEAYDAWVVSFFTWLADRYPGDEDLMALNGGLDPVLTEESARLWREHSAEFFGGTG